MDKWISQILGFSNLKSFGCVSYAYTKEDKIGKRALKYIFLGYLDGVMAYNLWCIEEGNNKMIFSRDVTFDENVFPFLSK